MGPCNVADELMPLTCGLLEEHIGQLTQQLTAGAADAGLLVKTNENIHWLVLILGK